MTAAAKRPYLIIWCAWLLHAAAWFLPVMAGEVAFPRWLPGWEAFRAAFCYVWPYEGLSMDVWYHTALATTSALSTILFLLGSPLVVMQRSRWMLSLAAWIASLAFVVNAHWYVLYRIHQGRS